MLKNVHSSAARTAGLLRIAWGDAQQAGAARPGAGPPDHSSPPALLQAGAPGPAGVPRLTGGAELLGEYKDSGYCQPPSLVRRPDGQVIQMSALLYKVTSRIDGARDAEAIAGLVSTDLGQILTADQARYLSTAKLVPSASSPARAGQLPRPWPARCSRCGRGARCCLSAPSSLAPRVRGARLSLSSFST